MNSEFYTGWLTHWQEPNSRRNATELAETLKMMLDMDVNVNFYMYFGGTNFGKNGRNMFRNYLDNADLKNNKHIPLEFLKNSRNT